MYDVYRLGLALLLGSLVGLASTAALAAGVAQTAAKAALARTVATQQAARDATRLALKQSAAGKLARTKLPNAATHGLRPPVVQRQQLTPPVRVQPLSAAVGNRTRLEAVQAGRPAQIVLSRTRYPQAAAHIREAQRLGQPSVLTLDRKGAAERRRESLRYIPRRPGYPISGLDRDEYPFAMTREGGFNASVRYIDAADNRGAGKSIERQVQGLPDGSRIRVLIGE